MSDSASASEKRAERNILEARPGSSCRDAMATLAAMRKRRLVEIPEPSSESPVFQILA